MPDLGVPELIIIAVVIMVLFGAKKLPDAARSVGRSLRIFKSEMREMHDDPEAQPAKELPAAPVAAPVTPPPPVAATPVAAEPATERAETR